MRVPIQSCLRTMICCAHFWWKYRIMHEHYSDFLWDILSAFIFQLKEDQVYLQTQFHMNVWFWVFLFLPNLLDTESHSHKIWHIAVQLLSFYAFYVWEYLAANPGLSFFLSLSEEKNTPILNAEVEVVG